MEHIKRQLKSISVHRRTIIDFAEIHDILLFIFHSATYKHVINPCRVIAEQNSLLQPDAYTYPDDSLDFTGDLHNEKHTYNCLWILGLLITLKDRLFQSNPQI